MHIFTLRRFFSCFACNNTSGIPCIFGKPWIKVGRGDAGGCLSPFSPFSTLFLPFYPLSPSPPFLLCPSPFFPLSCTLSIRPALFGLVQVLKANLPVLIFLLALECVEHYPVLCQTGHRLIVSYGTCKFHMRQSYKMYQNEPRHKKTCLQGL